MLQRAASNAYSWWWASHIRTKQTKWLEMSVQDMEDKVQGMLKLIEEDGDSFAKRAEMYYKRRPELIFSVEEAFKSFKALADRYDMLSKELQTANHTIATAFPEQVPFMDDDDESAGTRTPRNAMIPPKISSNAPKTPKPPVKDLKSIITTASKQLQAKKARKAEIRTKNVFRSGLTKEQALGEIDKIQKEILSLQTVKEFVKSSYESGVAKYWRIENQIAEMQDKVGRLQDEFNVERVIEDDEARSLMAEAALTSCQEILTQLEGKQEVSEMESRDEWKKLETARQLLDSIKQKYLKGQTGDDEKAKHDKPDGSRSETTDEGEQKTENEPSKQKEDTFSKTYLTVSQLADKIDQLVDKVINLETAVSSQTVLITTLKSESDDLHAQIRNLESEKESLINDSEIWRSRVRELEEKLARLENLNKNVKRQNSNLQTDFAEARSSLDHLSESVSNVKPDEEVEETVPAEGVSRRNIKLERNMPIHGDISAVAPKTEGKDAVASKTKGKEDVVGSPAKDKDEVKQVHVNDETSTKKSVTFSGQTTKEAAPVVNEEAEKDDDLSWQQMLLSGVEDREKILLKEYTEILKNFKDVKKKLSDMEKKEKDNQFDVIVKMKAQKKVILKKDEEIQHLRQKLSVDIDADKGFLPEFPITSEESTKNEEKEEEEEEEEDVDLTFADKASSASIIEEKFRSDINAVLDESLDFWLRFSTSFHQIKKFKTEVQDLQDEITKIEEKKKQDGSVSSHTKSEARPIYKHLREIQRELTMWLEQSVSLRDELKRRFTSLSNIQQEIKKALQDSSTDEDEIKFSSHQAAVLQGEIINMKQENNKVKEELHTGFDHVSLLQLEIEKTLIKLSEEFDISSDQPELKDSSRSKIPLRSFIFGKRPKRSIFSRYQILRSAMPNSNSDSHH